MKKKLVRSSKLFKEAKQYIAGGVNSPVRAFKSVGGKPLFISKGSGSKIYDVDGNKYIDYVMSWGPLILGHANPQVIKAIKETSEKGTSYGAPTELETELAKIIKRAFPSIELIRFVNSGTEAVMSAIRLARGYTGRDKIVKFEGCYHGHSDGLLVKSGSGIATLSIPDSAGVLADNTKDTIALPYNDIQAVKSVLEDNKEKIACIILEPVAGNMGVIPPIPGFLEELRELTLKEGIVLIFDEVITGFRVHYGGAQKLYNIFPDLTCLGKIIGGGMPVGAFGGKEEIMKNLAPLGNVYQAGTLSGNPVAMAAGIATLKVLSMTGVYEKLENMSKILVQGLEKVTENMSIPVQYNRVGAMFSVFFVDKSKKVINYAIAKQSNLEIYQKYFWKMLEEGIYFAPSQFESSFISLAHTKEDINHTIESSRKSLIYIAKHI